MNVTLLLYPPVDSVARGMLAHSWHISQALDGLSSQAANSTWQFLFPDNHPGCTCCRGMSSSGNVIVLPRGNFEPLKSSYTHMKEEI